MSWISRDRLERMDADIDALKRSLEIALKDVMDLHQQAALWQARYEELTAWVTKGGLLPKGSPMPAFDVPDPFAEDPDEKVRIEALYLNDPAAAMEEAAGDGHRVDKSGMAE